MGWLLLLLSFENDEFLCVVLKCENIGMSIFVFVFLIATDVVLYIGVTHFRN